MGEGLVGGGRAGRTEADDRGQRFEPAVGARQGLGGGAQREEDGVARLHADEGRPGIVAGGVGEAGDEGRDEEGEGGQGGGDGGEEVGEEGRTGGGREGGWGRRGLVGGGGEGNSHRLSGGMCKRLESG